MAKRTFYKLETVYLVDSYHHALIMLMKDAAKFLKLMVIEECIITEQLKGVSYNVFVKYTTFSLTKALKNGSQRIGKVLTNTNHEVDFKEKSIMFLQEKSSDSPLLKPFESEV